jgi:hypothetical protein
VHVQVAIITLSSIPLTIFYVLVRDQRDLRVISLFINISGTALFLQAIRMVFAVLRWLRAVAASRALVAFAKMVAVVINSSTVDRVAPPDRYNAPAFTHGGAKQSKNGARMSGYPSLEDLAANDDAMGATCRVAQALVSVCDMTAKHAMREGGDTNSAACTGNSVGADESTVVDKQVLVVSPRGTELSASDIATINGFQETTR